MNRRQMIAAVFALPVAAAAAALPRRETFTLDRERGELSWSYRSDTKWYVASGDYVYYRRISADEARRIGALVLYGSAL